MSLHREVSEIEHGRATCALIAFVCHHCPLDPIKRLALVADFIEMFTFFGIVCTWRSSGRRRMTRGPY